MIPLLFVLLAQGPTQKLTWVDHSMAATSSALIFADWWLTMDAIEQGLRANGRHETNPLLPEYPGKGHFTAMVALGFAANLAVVKIKKPWLRRVIWGTIIAFEIDAVYVNINSGSRFRL